MKHWPPPKLWKWLGKRVGRALSVFFYGTARENAPGLSSPARAPKKSKRKVSTSSAIHIIAGNLNVFGQDLQFLVVYKSLVDQRCQQGIFEELMKLSFSRTLFNSALFVRCRISCADCRQIERLGRGLEGLAPLSPGTRQQGLTVAESR